MCVSVRVRHAISSPVDSGTLQCDQDTQLLNPQPHEAPELTQLIHKVQVGRSKCRSGASFQPPSPEPLTPMSTTSRRTWPVRLPGTNSSDKGHALPETLLPSRWGVKLVADREVEDQVMLQREGACAGRAPRAGSSGPHGLPSAPTDVLEKMCRREDLGQGVRAPDYRVSDAAP